MKRLLFAIILIVCVLSPVYSYKLLYAEEYYKLYNKNLYQYPENYLGNIWFLEQALGRPFVNPLNALTKIDNKQQWERYRYLFYLHVNLKLVEEYRGLASSFDKRVAYFYNSPWQNQNLESLKIAEYYYKRAFYYWHEAVNWQNKLNNVKYSFLESIQKWEDERVRIASGELDYQDILETDLSHLYKIRDAFTSMNEDTY